MSTRRELPSPEETSYQLEQVDTEIIKKAMAATVSITYEALNTSGPFSVVGNSSGIHVGGGMIITTRHTFDKYETPPLTTVSDATIKSSIAQIIYTSKTLDLAVLQTELTDIEKAEVKTEKLVPSQTLFLTAAPSLLLPYSFRTLYIGDTIDLYPAEKSLEGSFILRESIDTTSSYTTTRAGFSGGGVFDKDGKLVGMIFGRSSRKEPKAIALKGSSIHSVLQTLPHI